MLKQTKLPTWCSELARTSQEILTFVCLAFQWSCSTLNPAGAVGKDKNNQRYPRFEASGPVWKHLQVLDCLLVFCFACLVLWLNPVASKQPFQERGAGTLTVTSLVHEAV